MCASSKHALFEHQNLASTTNWSVSKYTRKELRGTCVRMCICAQLSHTSPLQQLVTQFIAHWLAFTAGNHCLLAPFEDLRVCSLQPLMVWWGESVVGGNTTATTTPAARRLHLVPSATVGQGSLEMASTAQVYTHFQTKAYRKGHFVLLLFTWQMWMSV